jgi:hypothetical protein
MPPFLLRAALFVALCFTAYRYANHVPDVVAATASATEFSAERAWAHVRAIAARPHPIGSAEHRVAADYILAELRRLGLEPEIHEATAVGTRYAAAGRVRSILVRVRGTSTSSRQAVLLMAHYDAVPAAPGAGDDASGSAVLLETLRALSASPPMQHDVIALFADGEETGLLGAAAFVREHPWARDVAVTLNFEARGTHGPSLMFETGPGNLDVVRVLRRVGGGRATSLSTFVYRQLPNDTDLSETARLGKPAMNFAFLDGVNRYHTSQDDVSHLDPRSVQDHGNAALALARELAGNPLPRPETSDAVFFDFPLVGLVVYPEGWAAPLALLLLVPTVVLLLGLRREHPRWIPGVLLGIAGAVVSIGCATVAAVIAVRGIASLHAAVESGAPAQSGLYVAAVAMLALTVASMVYAVCRRWVGALLLYTGGALFVASLGITTSFAAPAVSFLFVWPALFMLTALALRGFGTVATEVAVWVATAIGVFTWLPIAYLMAGVALGLDATGAAVVAVFAVLGAWLLAHVLEPHEGRPWRTTAVLGVLTAILFVGGATTVRTDDEHPVGSTMAYGVDADSNTAYLGIRALTPGATSAWRRAMGNDPVVRAPAWFGRTFPVAVAAPAPGADVGRVDAAVLSDSTRGDSSWIRVRFTPAPGTSAVSLRADSGAVAGTVIDGRAVSTSGYRSPQRGRSAIDFVAPGDGFEIVFATKRAAPLTFTVLSSKPGIPRVPGLELPARPAGVIPIQRGDYTVVHQRMRIR